ncbi:unnamed protein product [Echinostoma caproni]|uniref:Uncharacterized protein n=1 Tax=Echinostoma caproni TaxID=27848 RepID=A0A183BAQ8_9TREM|nr:unnamed protein product [Echinostoma caproni]
MERYFRPERFDTDPNTPISSKIWRHWFCTFDRFLTKIGVEDPERLDFLYNYISPSIYDYVVDCKSYSDAVKTLEKLFIKPPNEVFARYLLVTYKEEPGQNFDQFFQKLKSLAKDCNFKAITAEKNQDDAIRDAFISGILSGVVRQRLLENRCLDLPTALELARSLEMVQQQSNAFQTSPM